MLVTEFLTNPNKIPRRVRFAKIRNLPRMEERFHAVAGAFGDIVGMSRDRVGSFVEFCPNHDPPTKDEVLPWLWITHPELKREILQYADERLQKIIGEYEEDTPHPAPPIETSEHLQTRVGRAWSCPWCGVRSTADGTSTDWVECPIRRRPPRAICLNCCLDMRRNRDTIPISWDATSRGLRGPVELNPVRAGLVERLLIRPALMMPYSQRTLRSQR